jgi:hypothetical protein
MAGPGAKDSRKLSSEMRLDRRQSLIVPSLKANDPRAPPPGPASLDPGRGEPEKPRAEGLGHTSLNVQIDDSRQSPCCSSTRSIALPHKPGTAQGGIMVTQMRNGLIEFRFYRPEARHVCVAGDFNDWNLTGTAMARGPDGWWDCQVRIAPGCYHFRYCSDGEWFLDYASFGLDHGPFGLNSVVKVEALAVRETSGKPEPHRTRSLPTAGHRYHRVTGGIRSTEIRLDSAPVATS